MTMRIAIIVGFLLFTGACCMAQDLGAFEEVTAGNFFGIGARQMAMGGTGIASSLDGAALYYNPAALVRIHRIELQLGLSHNKFSNVSSQAGNRYAGYTSIGNKAELSQTKTRFGSINLAIPVPTYRGTLTVGFGINRLLSFDRAALLNTLDRNGINEAATYAREFENGSIYQYSAGAGIEISPTVALGASLNVYSGDDNFTYDYFSTGVPGYFDESLERRINEDYIGATIKGGLLARPNSNLTIGLAVETPLDWQVQWSNYELYDSAGTVFEGNDLVEYDVTRPFIFGAGVAFRAGTFTLAGDAEYTDWSQLSYNDNPAMELDNDTLAILYRDVMNLRLGAEYQFPQAGLSLRAGLFSNPLPYNDVWIDNDRSGYSLGFGWLIDRVLMLEGAYVRGTFERHYTGPNGFNTKVEDKFQTAYFTVSYRY